MKKTNKFLKRYWFLTLLALVTIFLLGIRVWTNKFAPLPPPLPQTKTTLPSSPPNSQTKSLFGQKINGQLLRVFLSKDDFEKIPASLPVFPKLKETGQKNLSKITLMAKSLGFSGAAKTITKDGKQFYSWQKGNNYLVLDTQTGRFSFSGETPLVEGGLSPQNTKKLIKDWLLKYSLIDKETEIEIEGHVAFGYQLEPVLNLDEAKVYLLSYDPSLNNYPIINLDSVRPITEMRINKNGRLTHLTSTFFWPDLDIKSEIPSKKFDDVLAEIKNGEAELWKMVDSRGAQYSPLPSGQIEGILISKVSLVYSSIQKADNYQPFYLFSGKMTLINGNTYEAFLFLPATKR